MEQNQEWIRKRIESIKLNARNNSYYGMKGKIHTKETKRKMSLKAISRFRDSAERRKISETKQGKRFTEKHRENLSLSHLGQFAWNKGKRMNLESIEKVRQANLGRIPWNKGLKGIMKAWNKGKRLSPGQIRKMSGSNSHFWKGGISTLNELIRKSVEYKIWRKGVFEKDYYICLICGQVGGKINAHHIKSFSKILSENNIKNLQEALNCQELWNIDNGITLCIKCHYLNK